MSKENVWMMQCSLNDRETNNTEYFQIMKLSTSPDILVDKSLCEVIWVCIKIRSGHGLTLARSFELFVLLDKAKHSNMILVSQYGTGRRHHGQCHNHHHHHHQRRTRMSDNAYFYSFHWSHLELDACECHNTALPCNSKSNVHLRRSHFAPTTFDFQMVFTKHCCILCVFYLGPTCTWKSQWEKW